MPVGFKIMSDIFTDKTTIKISVLLIFYSGRNPLSSKTEVGVKFYIFNIRK